jgi:putative ABC transport system substrate-binding protein
MSDLADELAAKRLQLLKETVPPLRQVAMLYNATDRGMTQRYQVSATAAQALGLTVLPLGVREPEGFDEAFAAMTRDPPDGLFMVTRCPHRSQSPARFRLRSGTPYASHVRV